MSTNRFMLGILLAASIFLTGCLFLEHPIKQTFVRHSNPIEGWPICDSRTINKGIHDDYQDYINKLPAKERKCAFIVGWFQDGTGQHAVSIGVWLDGMWDGTEWEYVLIYDRNDKRVKVVKYLAGYYSL
jgi:hypothetical protein